MKYTFPRSALPVLRVLRRDVPRPKTLPEEKRHLTTKYTGAGCLRWPGFVCPMGLHPKANDNQPYFDTDFPMASERAIGAFYLRWDTFTDAQAAVDAVWPPKKASGK